VRSPRPLRPVVVPRFSELGFTAIVGVGSGLTVPLTLTSCSVAPVLVLLILPLRRRWY
jgi:hypothetical protein